MTSIATLGIEVKTEGVQKAEQELGKLEVAGKRVEAATARVTAAQERLSKVQSSGSVDTEKLARAQGGLAAAQAALIAAEERLSAARLNGLKSQQKIAPAMAQTAKTARELQFATRGLPAQFTDIATALSTGQRPLNVLLQQGGQLKDMFGGIGPAAAAMGRYLIGLVNPLTITVALVGGLALAMKNAEDESAGFGQALARTGDFAGRSVDQLRAMADQLNNIALVSRGDAVDALTQVAASGRFAGESFDLVAEAAARMKASAGQDIQDTVSAFKRLADDPLDAILRLNDAEHFLTQAQADRIASLEDEGRKQDAAAEAIRIYAQHLDEVVTKSEATMPEMARRWATLKDNIGNASSAVGGYIARLDDALQKQGSFLHGLQEIVNHTNIVAYLTSKASDALFTPSSNGSATATGSTPVNKSGGGFNFAEASGGSFDSSAFKARREAEEKFGRIIQSNLSKQQRLEAEIADIRKTGLAAGKSELEIDQQIAAARARFAENQPKGRKPRAGGDSSALNASDRFDDLVGGFRAQLEGPLQKAEQDHLRAMREIQQAAEKGKRSHEDLTAALALEGQAYEKAKGEIQDRYDAEVAALTGPIAQAQQAHEAALKRIDQLKKEAGVTGEQYNAMLANEANAYREDMLAAQRAANPLHALLDDMRFELDTIGRSNAERAVMNELRRQGIPLMSAEAQGALATASAFAQEAEAKQRSIDLMDDFRRGFSDALTDFVTGAKSAKEAFKDLFDGIAQQITRAIAQHWADQLFGMQGTSGGGSAGGWFQSILGALFSSGSGGNPWDAGNQPAGFASGGYTGDGPRNGVAGVVHYGEVVVPAKVVDDIRSGRSPSLRAGPAVLKQTIVVQGIMRDNTPLQIAQASAREQAKARRNA